MPAAMTGPHEVAELIARIAPTDTRAAEQAQRLLDGKTKPRRSLGRLEDLACRLAAVRGTARPPLPAKAIVVMAADHGVTEEGVSAYPQEVSGQMLANFASGGAAINVLARHAGAQLLVVDMGVVHPPTARAGLDIRDARIAAGTANFTRGPAMTRAQAVAAIAAGAGIAHELARDGIGLIAIGEMGIGNTASAALIMHRLAPAPLAECVGAGAGQDEAGMARKRAALARAAARSAASLPREVLSEFGGCEIAMMAGAVLGAAAQRRPVLVDGFIASAAALAAIRLAPAARDYCVFAHQSAERGHARLLEAVDAQPLLALGMRLGEGTGAVLAAPMLRAAARLLTDVADLSEVVPG